MKNSLANKRVMITAGASGIGKSIAYLAPAAIAVTASPPVPSPQRCRSRIRFR